MWTSASANGRADGAECGKRHSADLRERVGVCWWGIVRRQLPLT
ncbi:hypothetical protein C7S16_4771 [Burkholderia thailandensis]|uniref:Uncharacterized protein n=1 Tax=Burkholderia thailandensis TaxID=57975 RepID=A0AAW9CZH5_BURTH|nr:hypothetical protein [Burkholderia thailandensis]